MNLKNLSQKQKQYLILSAVGVVAILGIIVIGMKVSLSSIGKSRIELEDLTDKIERSDRSLSNSRRNEAAFFKTISELKMYLKQTPPDQNYYSWATETVYSIGRKTRLEIEAANEIVRAKQDPNSKDQVLMESYSLRIIAHGGYENVKLFLQGIRKKHPLSRITGVEVSRGVAPESHTIEIVIQWPFSFSHFVEGWDNVLACSSVANVDGTASVISKPEPRKQPTPGGSHVSLEPTPEKQPEHVVSEPDEIIPSTEWGNAPEIEIDHRSPVVVTEPKISESLDEKILSDIPVSFQEEEQDEVTKITGIQKPLEPPVTVDSAPDAVVLIPPNGSDKASKSASRLEALLRN